MNSDEPMQLFALLKRFLVFLILELIKDEPLNDPLGSFECKCSLLVIIKDPLSDWRPALKVTEPGCLSFGQHETFESTEHLVQGLNNKRNGG